MRILALLFGIVLLLPGVCSLGFMAALLPDFVARPWQAMGDLGLLAILWAFCFSVSLGGIVLIRNAIRGPASQGAGAPPHDPRP